LTLACVYDFLHRADKEPASSMECRGRRMGAVHWDGSIGGTSLYWRGRRTAPRKTDRDVAAGPPPCRTSP
jgi:hypothetical protein